MTDSEFKDVQFEWNLRLRRVWMLLVKSKLNGDKDTEGTKIHSGNQAFENQSATGNVSCWGIELNDGKFGIDEI